MTDHDHLFKELLSEFFPEFIDLFFPQVSNYLDRTSLSFEPQELFADLTEGETYETDLIAKVKFLDQPSYFIVHVEHQGRFEQNFDRRMFNYFAQLHRIYGLPVYPIVIFSHRSPRTPGDRTYAINFPDWEVLRFNYRVIRLNHLNWQEFVDQPNPVASALMAKMKIKRKERPQAKLACLRSLARLRLNPVQNQIVSGFIDVYLRLQPEENRILQEQLDKIDPGERGEIMQIVTSWMEQGLEQGREREVALVLRILSSHLGGTVSPDLASAISALSFDQLDELGSALPGFTSEADLRTWLQNHGLC